MKQKLNMAFALFVLMLTAACSGGGGSGSGGPGGGGAPAPIAIKFPSVKNSLYEVNHSSIQANVEQTVTITVKDQDGINFTLGTIWNLTIQVTCQSCTLDTNVSVVNGGINGNQQTFKFTPKEENAYSIEVLFNPTASYTKYHTDFPNEIDPDLLDTIAMTVPAFDVCTQTASSTYHGLRGMETIASKSRYALCDVTDLLVAAKDVFFLDKDLYIARDTDLTSYYQSGGAEFAFVDSCVGADCAGSYFTGSLYGNKKTITGFKRTNGLGLISKMLLGQVSYLTLKDSQQTGVSGGAFVGVMGQDATLLGVSAIGGSVNGTTDVGGLVGDLMNARIVNSTSTIAVNSNKNAGGLVGRAAFDGNNYNLIATSSSSSSVATASVADGTTSYAGGLVGFTDAALTVNDSYFNGSVTSQHYAGGIAGQFDGALSRSYVYATISGNVGAGGLFGTTLPAANSTVANSFINSTITAPAGKSGTVASDCNSLSVGGSSANHFFANSMNECGTQTSYTSQGVIVGNPSTTTDLMSLVKPITDTWSRGNWTITTSTLPTLK
jgi:hypothetical protein